MGGTAVGGDPAISIAAVWCVVYIGDQAAELLGAKLADRVGAVLCQALNSIDLALWDGVERRDEGNRGLARRALGRPARPATCHRARHTSCCQAPGLALAPLWAMSPAAVPHRKRVRRVGNDRGAFLDITPRCRHTASDE